ncbi:MAG TPA: M81 family metallopeptidase [Candidatus Baltobacteraceae bacterium]|nr:M81 family metallopeptidase [Candidatus Baltobacteraceae bacterium]
MKRVLLAALKHEVNTFVPGVASLDEFRKRILLEGPAVFSPARGSGQEIDGVLDVARAAGIEVIPVLAAHAGASRPVADAAFAYLRDRVITAAQKHRAHIDGVILCLHGAMATESLEDPEGELVAAVRDVVGPRTPIAISYDMHCHMTEQKRLAADAIVGYHTHPHVDFADTGARAMRILARALRGEVQPVIAQRKIRMIASAEKHNTGRPPMGDIFQGIADIGAEPGILAATIFLTQPWMDVAELGWSTVVVADGDMRLAQSRADDLARMAWERRKEFLVEKTPIADAVRAAVASGNKPFILADSADAVTGGAYGDGNVLLRELLIMQFQGSALLTLTDPEAAAACHAAGVGSTLTLPVGGKLTPSFYRPLTVTGIIERVSDGRYVCTLPPSPIDVGRSAVLVIGGIRLAISERPAPTIDQEFYRHLDLDPRDSTLVQVKSPGGFRAIYGPFAAGIFEIDTAGPTMSDLTRLPFRKVRRPLWPFDPDLTTPW